jgi:hypothetical protein
MAPNTVRRTVAVFLALAFCLGGLSAGRRYWEGRPAFTAGENRGYYVWNDPDGWHIRWTTRGDRHVFAGTLKCDGVFEDFEAVSAEGRDFIKKISLDTLRFDTVVKGGADGMNFRLSPSTKTLTFDLRIDGRTALPEEVRVGRDKVRPEKVPFTIVR